MAQSVNKVKVRMFSLIYIEKPKWTYLNLPKEKDKRTSIWLSEFIYGNICMETET